jgi:putative colanic acid biosynthesis acetyltransferase WcaF
VKSSISIGNDVWIAADAFVGPDVKVGHRSIVGARSVVMKDVGSDCLVAGNRARKIKEI